MKLYKQTTRLLHSLKMENEELPSSKLLDWDDSLIKVLQNENKIQNSYKYLNELALSKSWEWC